MRNIFILFFLTITSASISQDRFAKTDKLKYNHGDTITINCNLANYKGAGIHFASLYLFIENADSKKQWTYRYPLLDGQSETTLIIDSTLPDGKSAFNFLARKQFFSLYGTVKDLPGSQLNYSMLTKNNTSFIEQTQTDQNGNFYSKGILFADTSYIIFSVPKTTGSTSLDISIVTPLDSLFTSDTSTFQFVYVGRTDTLPKAGDANYQTDLQTFFPSGTTLPGVTVTTTQKKKIEIFNEEYSTGLFQNGNARIFDGLENNLIAESADIFEFLRGRVAGLQIMPNGSSYILQWRGPSNFRGGSNVDVFLDEFKVDRITRGFVNPSDVAMIKAYPPPAFLSAGGQRGAIAIYTKHGGYENTTSKNKFKVFGYSSLETAWK